MVELLTSVLLHLQINIFGNWRGKKTQKTNPNFKNLRHKIRREVFNMLVKKQLQKLQLVGNKQTIDSNEGFSH